MLTYYRYDAGDDLGITWIVYSERYGARGYVQSERNGRAAQTAIPGDWFLYSEREPVHPEWLDEPWVTDWIGR